MKCSLRQSTKSGEFLAEVEGPPIDEKFIRLWASIWVLGFLIGFLNGYLDLLTVCEWTFVYHNGFFD